MNHKDFESVVEDQLDTCKRVLYFKAHEYADDNDRLHNFKVAGSLQNESPAEALCGMMAKHIVSIFDLVRHDRNDKVDMYVWEEKIGDAINYLLLLKAIVVERHLIDLAEEDNESSS